MQIKRLGNNNNNNYNKKNNNVYLYKINNVSNNGRAVWKVETLQTLSSFR